jgi:hypothetical protein
MPSWLNWCGMIQMTENAVKITDSSQANSLQPLHSMEWKIIATK